MRGLRRAGRTLVGNWRLYLALNFLIYGNVALGLGPRGARPFVRQAIEV